MVVEVDVGKVLVVEWEKYEATAVRNYYSLTRKVTKGLVPCLDCRNRILFLMEETFMLSSDLGSK